MVLLDVHTIVASSLINPYSNFDVGLYTNLAYLILYYSGREVYITTTTPQHNI